MSRRTENRESIKRAIEVFERQARSGHAEVTNLRIRKGTVITCDVRISLGDGLPGKTYRNCKYEAIAL